MKRKILISAIFVIAFILILIKPSFATNVYNDTSYIDGLLNSAPLNPMTTGVDGLDAEVQRIISLAGPSTSDKVKYCFNYLIDHAVYLGRGTTNEYTPIDTSTYSVYHYDPNSIDTTLIGNAATILTYHTGVCDHYSAAFVVMTRAIGLDSYLAGGYINTKSGSKNGHAWAIVRINGVDYVFDPQAQQNSSSEGFFYGHTYEYTRCYELIKTHDSNFNSFRLQSPAFSAKYYAMANPDVVKVVGSDSNNLMRHYLQYGAREGRVPSPVFIADDYFYYNPDVERACGGDKKAAYYHYINSGIKEGRRASKAFSASEYKELNSDLSNMDTMDLLNHFGNFGIFEGRQTSIVFIPRQYSDYNGDLKKAYGSDWVGLYNHFIAIGAKEGRKSSAVYCGADYIKYNQDLKQAYGNDAAGALNHFISFGLEENRRTCENFELLAYQRYNQDLLDAFGIGPSRNIMYYVHYLIFGMNENRKAC